MLNKYVLFAPLITSYGRTNRSCFFSKICTQWLIILIWSSFNAVFGGCLRTHWCYLIRARGDREPLQINQRRIRKAWLHIGWQQMGWTRWQSKSEHVVSVFNKGNQTLTYTLSPCLNFCKMCFRTRCFRILITTLKAVQFCPAVKCNISQGQCLNVDTHASFVRILITSNVFFFLLNKNWCIGYLQH